VLIGAMAIAVAFVMFAILVLGVVGNHDAFLVEEQNRRQRERQRREFERALRAGMSRRID